MRVKKTILASRSKFTYGTTVGWAFFRLSNQKHIYILYTEHNMPKYLGTL